MSIADAMATNGMKEMGYEYINFDGKHALILQLMPQARVVVSYLNMWGIREGDKSSLNIYSDCWADSRDSNGNIVPDKDRFPE